MKCPFCDTDNQPGEDFCTNCGGYLNASPPPPSPVTGSTSVTAVGSARKASSSGSATTGAKPAVSGSLTPNVKLQNGRYIVEKVLGQGGMGTAVLAKDTRVSNRLMVIKELISNSTDPAKHQEDVRNFEREVETLAALDHALIPTVTDSFQENGRYFMVQEYAAGENLEDHMERLKQPMSEQEALSYASQVLDILDYLEQQTPPIVHRDIKPANIIVGSKDKRARLVDFGIARAQANKNAKRQQTAALGTPGYAPPEQYQGKADGRSDLYALGATLHHLLTNRDPRDHAPFAYPPVRSLNHKLTPDIERVLERALKINVNERYQNAAEMKDDIDEILAQHFSSNATRQRVTSPSMPATGLRAQPQGSSAQSSQPGWWATSPSAPTSASGSSKQAGMHASSPAQKLVGNHARRNFLLLAFVVLFIAAVLLLPRILASKAPYSGGPGAVQPSTPNASPSLSSNGIGVTRVGNEMIGISDGSYALDTSITDATLKEQGADKLRQGDRTSALGLWRTAVGQDSNDAEALIYLENLSVANYPHVTFVVGTTLSGTNVGIGRDDLLGAYVAQKEFNSGTLPDGTAVPSGVKMRLLIANSGGQAANATLVANQIVQLAKSDTTFVGVMGWPLSSLTYPVITVLNQAKIPIVSQTASDDGLTGTSPYFFRVVPANKAQGIAGAKYAEDTLKASTVALFVASADPYSQSLANDFSQQFRADGKTVVATESYTVGKPDTVQSGVQDALQHNPDLIYFAGLAGDVNPLLSGLNSANVPTTLKVLGGDALYELGGYKNGLGSRLIFTTFSYPDEWSILEPGAQQPAFFNDYSSDFDPNHQHKVGTYGFTRPTNDTMLSYDATYALLKAYSTAATGKKTVMPDDVKNALATTSFQGVSGWIQFGPDGDPVGKAIVILYVLPGGFVKMDKALNNFTKP